MRGSLDPAGAGSMEADGGGVVRRGQAAPVMLVVATDEERRGGTATRRRRAAERASAWATRGGVDPRVAMEEMGFGGAVPGLAVRQQRVVAGATWHAMIDPGGGGGFVR